MDRSHWPTRLIRLGDRDDDAYVAGLTPSQRMELVWPITIQAWRFADPSTPDEPRLLRHIVRTVRGGR